ncbi:MAG: hypothetical protein KDA99_28925 [Planctomycetales bacterium]|nr:hypothetical protein [Planctomycetales bacterium]
MTWELGAGLGHVMLLRPVVEALLDRRHQVFVAMQDISKAFRTFRGLSVGYLQAPFRVGKANNVPRALNHGHLLRNVGFGDLEEMAALTNAWRHLYAYTKPDLIVFDHSPMAMVASRGMDVRRVVVGTGFEIPPDETPWPPFRYWLRHDKGLLQRSDAMLLAEINQLVGGWRGDPFERLGEIYSSCDQTVLATVRELDHYPSRTPDASYFGLFPNRPGIAPNWPTAGTRRAFAYLNPSPNLADFLRLVLKEDVSLVLYPIGCNDSFRQDLGVYSNLMVVDEPVDLQMVATTCDFAILNGGLGGVSSLIAAGLPLFLLPLHTEQIITAKTIERLGVGGSTNRHLMSQIRQDWGEFLQHLPCYQESAKAFAQRQVLIDREDNLRKAVLAISTMLA